MAHDCKLTVINVLRLGSGLDASEVFRILGIANQAQRAVRFNLHPTVVQLGEQYRLPNGGYALDTALKELLLSSEYKSLTRPLVALSALPLGDVEFGEEAEYFYFSSSPDEDPQTTVVSTYPLKVLPNRNLYEYILLMLSTFLLVTFGDLYYHSETLGCLLDYCDELADAEQSFRGGKLCESCERQLDEQVGKGKLSIDLVAAAIKILHRAVGRHYCFVAMPFDHSFDPVFASINTVLSALNWTVVRTDQKLFPRLITDRMLREIMISDIMIADLSGNNPNVFYELGLGQALGRDALLITQEAKVPFDIQNRHTVFYRPDSKGLKALEVSLATCVGKPPAR